MKLLQTDRLFKELKQQLEGDFHYDDLTTSIYATDASVYRMIPQAVAFPKTTQDIKVLIEFAKKNKTSLIPRTAGTSLAGQCVGTGIVVDVSKYFNKILRLNQTDKTVTVQPGIVRDELNNYLKPFGLFFWSQHFNFQQMHDRRYGWQQLFWNYLHSIWCNQR